MSEETRRVVILNSAGDHLLSEGFEASISRGQLQVMCGRQQMTVCTGSEEFLRKQLRRLAWVLVLGGVFEPDNKDQEGLFGPKALPDSE